MPTNPDRRQESPSSDRERGRSDDAPELLARIPDAPAGYLDGALENPRLGAGGALRILRSRFATASIVARIGKNRDWMRAREAKKAFASHPLAAVVSVRQVLPFLPWKDVAEVATNVRLSPAVRRDAEKLLRTRLPELSTGERTALARHPSRAVVELLRDDTDPAVLRAVAGNPRALEADIVRSTSLPAAPPAYLAWLCERSPWGLRRDVVLTLLRHPATPRAAALKALSRLSSDDLDALHGDESVPRLVRVAASRYRGSNAPPGVVPADPVG